MLPFTGSSKAGKRKLIYGDRGVRRGPHWGPDWEWPQGSLLGAGSFCVVLGCGYTECDV